MNRSAIQYVFVLSEKNEGYFSLILNKANQYIATIGLFPKDIHQLVDSSEYYAIQKGMNTSLPYNVLFFDDESFIESNPIEDYSKLLEFKERIVVYFFSKKAVKKKKIISAIKKFSGELFFYTTFENSKISSLEIGSFHYFKSAKDLIDKIESKIELIRDNLSVSSKVDFTFDKFYNSKFKNRINPDVIQFVPSHSNTMSTNHLTSHLWSSSSINKIFIEHEDRQDKLIETAETLDNITDEILEEYEFSNDNNHVFIVIPFVNPSLVEYFKSLNKEVTKILKIEQSLDYLQYSRQDEEITASVLQVAVASRLRLLDGISFLHSSITYSPVLRLPLVSTSIYTELSFFNPIHDFFYSRKAESQKIEAILKFGNKLRELTMKTVVVEYLKTKSTACVISDLPIEWLALDNTPLSFSHDLCRIPEFNYQGLLNHYSSSVRLVQTISTTTLGKTLVILGANLIDENNNAFKDEYALVEKMSKDVGFHYFYPESILQLQEKIIEFQPEILIFDSHGIIEKSTKTVQIQIGKENLTGELIVSLKITAPIVYLSCCHTDPNFGYTTKINDAFFEAGAMTVTGTFLPISVKRGTKVYLRLLTMLKKEIESGYFINWLGFISHIIRTSFIHDVMHKQIVKRKKKMTDDEKFELGQIIGQLMNFKFRYEIFNKLLSAGIQLSEDLNLKINETDAEFLMYSHYGRPDLIKFDRKSTDNTI